MINVTHDIGKTDEWLNNYENQWGLPQEFNSSIHSSAFEILNTDFRNVKLTSEEYLQKSITLSQYAFQIQRLINIDETRVHYLNARIDKIVLPLINQQQAYYYNDKRNLAISSDSVASELLIEKVKIELRIKRLQFLSTKIENVSNKFMEGSRATRKTEKIVHNEY
jgi:hypothetical protein